VVGLLGVGFDDKDGQVRITQAGDYQVIMGSRDSHRVLQKICLQIKEKVDASGRVLNDYTPEEFIELMETIY
jgi:hypothetical protein